MRIFSALLIMIFGQFSIAQTPLDSAIKEKSKNIKFTETQDHLMINLTIDNVIANASDTNFKSSWFNPNIGLYFMYDLPIAKTGFSFAPGVGFTFSKTSLSKSLLVDDTSGTYFTHTNNVDKFNSPNRYESSSFYTSWLEAPIELRWHSKPLNGRSRFKVAVGMRFGVRLASNSKYSYIDNATGEKTVISSPYKGINGIRYGATFRVGYGAFNVFGYYGMSQLIKGSENVRNHDLRQYSIGISITGL